MIDPMLSLAFTVHANPGVYALMLGSGLSRTSGIPTGWEIVLDLVRKLAALRGEKCEPDEETWYRNTFGAEPNYSVLLYELAKTPAERKQLLSPYFQPTQEEREQGRKTPTPAHRAIAELMVQGYFRVVLTTNFDTLMEDALREAGVAPYVVRHSSDIAGAPPLSQGGCLVVKLHGDYLDTRIRNTPEELQQYEDNQNELLDRVIDEFGLVVCGWSAEWDFALRDAITRCKNHRYMTYWASVGAPRPDAQHLIGLRTAQVLTIPGADPFFRDLADKVAALRDFDQPHPLSGAVAVAQVKRFLEPPRNRIRLNDLVLQETEQAISGLALDKFPGDNVEPIPYPMAHQYAQKYRASVEVLLHVVAHGCYWGEPDDSEFWTRSLRRLGNLRTSVISVDFWRKQRLLPATMLMYTGGVAAIANGQYKTAADLLKTDCVDMSGEKKPAAILLTSDYLPGEAAAYPDVATARFPLSSFLYNTLRTPLTSLLPEDELYAAAFNEWEYLLSLAYVDAKRQTTVTTPPRAPMGLFSLDAEFVAGILPTGGRMQTLGVEEGYEHFTYQYENPAYLLDAGFFGNDKNRYQAAKKVVLDLV